ncbi:MAG: lytic transglycosylase domain-containing protein, partial [Clostridiales bacterium]|nr:lytic transglycosylase domain-containing protein [Clostridiales bacterium]
MAGIKKILAIFVAFVVITVLLGYSSKVMFPIKYRDIVIKCSNENNLDPALVFAVIKIESNFKAKAVSSKNARGLMQISEKTAEWGSKELGLIDFSMDDLFEPEIN